MPLLSTMSANLGLDEDTIFEPRQTTIYVTIHQQTERVDIQNYAPDLADASFLSDTSVEGPQPLNNDGDSASTGSPLGTIQFDESVVDLQSSIHFASPLSQTTITTSSSEEENEEDGGSGITDTQRASVHLPTTVTSAWKKFHLRRLWEWVAGLRAPKINVVTAHVDVGLTHRLGPPTWCIANKPGRRLFRGALIVFLTPENRATNHVFQINGTIGTLRGRLVITASPMQGGRDIFIIMNHNDYAYSPGAKIMTTILTWIWGEFDNHIREMEGDERDATTSRVSTQTWSE
ncbi:hypothetical protein BC835DRAFT_1421835 [Cytidiella melzeri]|nr:hypothetical protein BC835DRAFT_1421835 [Cytidiella melzeri]